MVPAISQLHGYTVFALFTYGAYAYLAGYLRLSAESPFLPRL